jgi:hypothetical protein
MPENSAIKAGKKKGLPFWQAYEFYNCKHASALTCGQEAVMMVDIGRCFHLTAQN